MKNCQQTTQLLSDGQERKLSLKERAELKVHVMMCSGCRNFAQQMNVLRDITRAYAKGFDDQEADVHGEVSSGNSKDADQHKE